ncbi:MAG: phosphatidate cytidylyltransferase [Novosphingobium sp.]|nr:phosphatidate cytidylyltransferase [Novosphingobium sp.]
MIAVAGSALWLGGYWWTAFVAAVALGVLWEWWGLVAAINQRPAGRLLWAISGLFYVGLAATVLIWPAIQDIQTARMMPENAYSLGIWARFSFLLPLIVAIVATDVGAYFAGRTIGGPKIAPRISPSKTWAGLAGGMIASGFAYASTVWRLDSDWSPEWYWRFVVAGAIIAVIAQSGDFFESWMKRRAGVKDSGSLIPGHGGFFDRVDGLLAVAFVFGLFLVGSFAASQMTHDMYDDSSIKLHQ